MVSKEKEIRVVCEKTYRVENSCGKKLRIKEENCAEKKRNVAAFIFVWWRGNCEKIFKFFESYAKFNPSKNTQTGNGSNATLESGVMKLRVGVPKKDGFRQFVNVVWDSSEENNLMILNQRRLLEHTMHFSNRSQQRGCNNPGQPFEFRRFHTAIYRIGS
ncbi:glutamate receptor 2.8 [Spatholobus suberectus]|nr:glutamate receptor 2.8 [Spatholobus suberectus]